MNKIFNINLGGYPFVIDDEAYFKLDKYLSHIKKHFSKSEGCDEIISDIEARIAELFNEHLKGQPIVSMREVDEVIKTMGTPKDFGDADESYRAEERTSETAAGTKYRSGKRLYRDTDDKVVAGVCSGLAAYFGVEDPLIFRLIFAVLFFSGVGFIAYLIFWIAVPAAKTSAEKLSMKGEPINVTNIARKVEEELNNLSNTITDFAKDLGSKK
jgi:phage shock protein PspC (stress-responsive transcriptional regulator)